MFALTSFGTGIYNVLGREDFLAFYLTCGAFASLSSRIYKYIRKMPNGSLGASGALMGFLGLSAMIFPNANVGIILLPFSFNIQNALFGMIIFDIIGLITRRFGLDHVAHLAGLTFGYLYYKLFLEEKLKNRRMTQRKK